jgi:hypothetical protein
MVGARVGTTLWLRRFDYRSRKRPPLRFERKDGLDSGFRSEGNRIGALRLNPPDKLEGAGSILFSHKKLYVLSTYGNRVIQVTP